MSYAVNFYRFAKKANSTKIPTADPDVTYECEILPGTSILAPTLKLNTNFLDPSNLTYAFIPTLTRYYFISNWYYDRGLWQCDLQTDVLASYKTQIGNFSLYVLRSTYEMDGRIVDTAYPIKVGASFSVAQNNINPLATEFSNGYFVVGIINGDAAAMGVTSYYVFTNTEFRSFASFLMGNTSYLNSPSEVSDELLKCLVNPTQYVSSCIWLPIAPPMGAAISVLPFGWWTVNASCHRLSGYTRTAASATISVPKHPAALTRGYYLLQEPYSTYYLDIPPFGSFTIPANNLLDTDLLDLNISIDCITGMGRLDIVAGPTGARGTINIVAAQVGVPVALAQNAPDITIPSQLSSDTTSAPTPWAPIPHSGGNTAFGKWLNEQIDEVNDDLNWIKGKISPSISNIANALVAAKLPIQVIGGNGGFMSGYFPIRLIATFATIADDNTTEWGRPLCRVKTLNTIPGYIQCADADFELSCTAEERNAIANYLTGGFFYE